jgi:Flp pilus assembly protein TadG
VRSASLPIARGAAGTAAVEFALVLPLFLILIGAIVVYGFYFTVWIAVTESAAAGARASVAGLTDAERISTAKAEVNAYLNSYGGLLSPANATVVAQDEPGSNGGAFQVSVTYNIATLGLANFSALLPVPSGSPSATVTVSNGGL